MAEDVLGREAKCRHCGRTFLAERAEKSAVHATASQSAGQKAFGRFQILARLGTGAFGTVYRARDTVLDREVALKVPRAEALKSPESRARFLREPKAAAQLRHPNIVPVFDAGSVGQDFYIASAYIEGRTLEDFLEHEQADFRSVARIARELADALNYAHGMGVVHRDVKPANVMLDGRGSAMLTDFGLARLENSDEKVTQDGTVMGTPAYMAPEQADRSLGEVGPASDQYSLGVVLYEMLCGQTPFSGPPAVLIFNLIHQTPPSPRSVRPAVPSDLVTICLKAMAKNPAERYADCDALAEDLRRWLDGEPIRARRMGLVERTGRWAKRNPILAVLSLAVAVLAVVSSVAAVGLRASERELAKNLADEQAETERAESETRKAEQQTKAAQEQEKAAQLQEKLAKEALAKLQTEETARLQAETDRKAEADKRAKLAEDLKKQEEQVASSATAMAEAKHKADEAAKAAAEERVKAIDADPWTKYTARLAVADAAIVQRKLTEAQAALAECPEEYRAWEWHYLKALCANLRPEEKQIAVGAKAKTALSADGRYLAALFPPNSGTEGEIQNGLWRLPDCEKASKMPFPWAANLDLVLSPDGSYASKNPNRSDPGIDASFYNVRTGRRAPAGTINFELYVTRRFSPDGKYAILGLNASGSSFDSRPDRIVEVATGRTSVVPPSAMMENVPLGGTFSDSGRLGYVFNVGKERLARVFFWSAPALMAGNAQPTIINIRLPESATAWDSYYEMWGLVVSADDQSVMVVIKDVGYLQSLSPSASLGSVEKPFSISPDHRRVAHVAAGRIRLWAVETQKDLPPLASLGWDNRRVGYWAPTHRGNREAQWHPVLTSDWSRLAMWLPSDGEATKTLFHWSLPAAVTVPATQASGGKP